MLKLESDTFSFSKVLFPLLILIAGISLIIYSFPGEGKNITNAAGLFLSLTGAIWIKVVRFRSRK